MCCVHWSEPASSMMLAETLGERAGIRMHTSKTRTWNFAGKRPTDLADLDPTSGILLASRSSALLSMNSWRISSRNGWQRSRNCGPGFAMFMASASPVRRATMQPLQQCHHDSGMQQTMEGRIPGRDAGGNGKAHHHPPSREDSGRRVLGLMGRRFAHAPSFATSQRRTRQPKNSKRAHFRAPALQTPPKFHERTPRERKKKENCGRGEKKREILGPPPFGPHPSGPSPFGAPQFGAPPSFVPKFNIQKLAENKLAVGRSRIGRTQKKELAMVVIGQSRSRSIVDLASGITVGSIVRLPVPNTTFGRRWWLPSRVLQTRQSGVAWVPHCSRVPRGSLFRILVPERLRLPLSITEARCVCGALDCRGQHRGVCHVLAFVHAHLQPKRTFARLCREAGATVRLNAILWDMNINVPAADEWAIEVLASGLEMNHGAQLAVDITVRSAVTSCGRARLNPVTVDGAVLVEAAKTRR